MLPYSPAKIISLRQLRGWNQSELARAAGLSSPSVWALERGTTKLPKFDTLRAVAGALGVPLAAIMSDTQATGIDETLAATMSGLTPANKAALLAAARALLDSQK